MPTISGVLAYDSANSYTYPNAAPAGRITGVPIVLQDIVSNKSLTVLTDATGAFTFNNVPAGTYNLVESWLATGGVSSPGDFTNAVVSAAPTPSDPPITKVTSPPAAATRLQSLTRNTIPLTVTTPNITGQNFVDGPITEQPIVLQESNIIGSNLITAAQTGEWGTLPAGSANQLIAPTEPYPGVSPSEVYTANPASIAVGSAIYNVTNIAYGGSYTTLWYSISNHTTFDETSRFMVINLAGTGPASNERFFQTTIANVKANTYYVGTAWVLYQQNSVIGTPPQVGVKVSNTGGTVIFQSPTPQLTFTNPPKWVQIGGVFFTGNNTTVVVAYQSLASGTLSNDIMADDFAVYELNINNILTSQKTVDKTIAKVGDTISYTIVLKNTGTVTAQTVQFSDTIPSGTTFNSGTVVVNQVAQPTFNPATGFNPGNIAPGGITTITFKVTATSVPSNGLALNDSTAVYSFPPVSGGITIPNSVQSNQTSTDIVNATISKNVSALYSDVNNTLTYTLTYFNGSQITATNVLFVDTIPSGTTFVNNSLTVDNVPVSGSPNPPGISLSNIAPNTTITIKFNVLTNSTATPNVITNRGTIGAVFTNTLGNNIGVTVDSNIVTTTISSAILNSTKQVSKSYADIGDILTYTIVIKNTGTVTAQTIQFSDTIPNGTSFVANSFKQDNTVIGSPPSGNGVTLPNNLGPGGTTTITFQVRVNTIPSPNPIPNSSTSSYTYTINPSIPNGGSGSTSSNIVTTQINNVNLGNIVKGVNKQYAKIGDVITYTITIPNLGSTTANNVIFKDTIPNGTTFIANSIVLNGSQQNGALVAPPTGLSIGTIAPNSTATLSFQVLVNTIPSPNPIPNSGNVSYNYNIDPVLGTTGSGSNNTNIVNTTINSAVINSTKKVTPTNCIIGDTVFYTIVLTNSGNSTANNVTFIDTIPNGTTFNTNSLSLNGATQIGQSPAPPTGFNVGSIAPNGIVTITFNVTVNTIPTPNPIPNSSYTNYNFVVNGATGETAPNTSLSNTVSTYVNPNSNPLKIADKQYVKPGDIITYTVQWENRLNVTATDVVFIDTIPNDTTFITNSLTLNGVTISGAIPSPPNGVNVGTIPSGVYTTITFKVIVNTIPNPNPIPNQAIGRYTYVSDTILGTVTTETAASNIVNTQVNYASIPSSTKQVSKTYAKVGDVLTYTISFTNIGNTTATNIKLIDTIPNGTSFNINSVFLNGANQPGAVVAPPTGLSVGSLAVNATATVVFTVTVDTVPSPNPIPNTANVGYDYTVDPVVNTKDTGGVNTNTVNTTVNYANLGIRGKTVDKSFANTSDTLLYTITVRNTGNVTANNVILADTIPNDTSFINGSVLVNGGSTATVPTGNVLRVNVGNISPNGVVSLTFRVQITGAPNPNPIPNSANAAYTYTIDPASPNGQSASNNTNIVNTQVNSASLGGITKFVDKTFATCGDIITYTISIPNSGNITANNVILSDTVPNGTVFVANSILVNGVLSSATSPISVPIGSINPGATTTVSFQVQVVC